MATLKERFDSFIKKANEIHDKYNYSEVEYKNYDTKVKIICNKHGAFFQTPSNHINRRSGCPKCANENSSIILSSTSEEFIPKATLIHNNKYDYSYVIYKNNATNIKIFCKEHNLMFEQTPSNHLSGARCPLCAKTSRQKIRRTPLEIFLKMCYDVHGDKYDYSHVTYDDYMLYKVIIHCKKHGLFTQNTKDHLYAKSGCPKCQESKGELEIKKILDTFGITYVQQKTFNDLYYKSKTHKLRYDFYLNDYNILIEYDGIYHFEAINKKVNQFKDCLIRDGLKDNYAKTHNLLLIRIPYLDFKNIESIIKALIKIE